MLHPVKQNGRYGYINEGGGVIVEPEFLHCEEFRDGLGLASKRHDITFFDELGKIAFSSTLGWVESFSEGMAVFSKDPLGIGMMGYLDKRGDEAIACNYETAYSFSGGAAVVELKHEIGVIRSSGEWFIAPRSYSYIGSFVSNLAPFSTRDKKWGYVDLDGNVRIEARYELAFPAAEELLLVKNEGKYGFMSLDGDWVILPKFHDAKPFREGHAACCNAKGRWAFISKSGDFLSEPTFLDLRPLSNGLAAACAKGFATSKGIVAPIWIFCDTHGNECIAEDFEAVGDFSGELAAIYRGEDLRTQEIGYISKTGRWVWNLQA